MGAWGTGIFQDDTSCDIRDAYRDRLGEGLSAADAKERILKAYAGTFNDLDEGGLAWMALAATQWKIGCLDDETRERAVQAIDSRRDLERWKGSPDDLAERARVLEALRAQLVSPRPSERKIAKKTPCECPWVPGDVIAWRLNSNRLALFRVFKQFTDQGGTYPECEILDWEGEKLPSIEEIESVAVRRSRADRKHTIYRVMLVGMSKKWDKRVLTIARKSMPLGQRILRLIPGPGEKEKKEGASVVHFKYLDDFLKNWFLME